MASSTPWSGAQIAALKEHWRKPDDQVQVLVNACGPYRTVKAIIEYRCRVLRLVKPPSGGTGPVVRKADDGADRSNAFNDGWPLMRGSPEERERRYLRALHAGLKEEHRRIAQRDAA